MDVRPGRDEALRYGDDLVAQLDVARALAALPAGKRACVVLRHLVDLSVEETAAVLGISPAASRARSARACACWRGPCRAMTTGLADTPRRSRSDVPSQGRGAAAGVAGSRRCAGRSSGMLGLGCSDGCDASPGGERRCSPGWPWSCWLPAWLRAVGPPNPAASGPDGRHACGTRPPGGRRRIRLDRPFTHVEVGFGAIWVAGQGALLRIDPHSNRVIAAIEVPGGAVRIVVAAGTVWVTQYLPERDPDIVTRIDARTNRLLSPVVEAPHMSGAMCDGLDAIWVSSSRSTVSRIDPRSGAVTQRLHRVAIVQAVGGGSLWGTFADNAGEVVRRIDPGTGRVVAAIRIPHGRRMAFGLGTLWVAQEPRTMTPGGDEPATMKPGKLYRIDPATNRVLGRPVPMPGIGPTALAVGEGAVWAGELDGKALTRFNLAP